MNSCQMTINKSIESTENTLKFDATIEQGTLRKGSMIKLGKMDVGRVMEIIVANQFSADAVTSGYPVTLTVDSDLFIGDELSIAQKLTA